MAQAQTAEHTSTQPQPVAEQDPFPQLQQTYTRLKKAFQQAPYPSLQARKAKLTALEHELQKRQGDIEDAIQADFGCRSRIETLMSETFICVSNIRYTRKKLKKWMRPQKRDVHMMFKPAKNYIMHQPKGVVGIIAPWNYPVQLSLVPLTTAVAAGNRVMLKPSEITPQSAELLREIVEAVFSEDEVAVATGGPEVGAAFSKLPFDHLLFTGSTQLGRIIMKAAAENLTPVTLELGGKSPALVHESFPFEKAADRIATGKCFNAGQTCIAPDYTFVPAGREQQFVDALKAEIGKSYPTIKDNPDYTSIVNERHFDRIQALLEDAREKGAEVIEINPAGEQLDRESGKIAPTVVLGVNDDMRIMQEEIFGPLMPVLSYNDLDEALQYIADHPRPLAFYYFDYDKDRVEQVMHRTIAGGVSINETLAHEAQEDMPFGGIGDSGIGAYHGLEGFETFSHKKPIFWQSRINGMGLVDAPYKPFVERMLRWMIGK